MNANPIYDEVKRDATRKVLGRDVISDRDVRMAALHMCAEPGCANPPEAGSACCSAHGHVYTFGNAVRAMGDAPFLGGSGASARLAAATGLSDEERMIALCRAVADLCGALHTAAAVYKEVSADADALHDLRRALTTTRKILGL